MKKTCTFTTLGVFIHMIILGIVAIFSHFAYDLSGKNIIVGLFNPVNESVWEHLKFMFFPLLIWWIVLYFIKFKKREVPLNTYIVSAAISLIVAPLTVILLFYSYSGITGIESVLIDILLVFICYFISLLVASHFLEYSKPNKQEVTISIVVIAIMFIAFIAFTFITPYLPIFYDTVTKTYGK